jgi:hypothetical protein
MSAQSGERPVSALCSRWVTTRRMGEDAPKRTAPPPLPERLAVTGTTLGDEVGEILLFCRSSARHIVRPADRFPLAGRGVASA